MLIQYDPGHDLTVIVRLVEDATRVASKLPELFPPTQQGSRRLRQTEQAWHAKASGQVISLWKTSAETGLGAEAAALRLEAYGPNVIPGTPVRTAFAILMAQIRTLPNALLLGSAVLSVVTGGIADAVAVAAVVALNTAIGFATEYKAERTIRALLRISEPQAVVVRDGSPRQIPASGVVPGDLLALSSGNEVPADARLIECSGLSVDESPLTGESLPVEKSTDAIARERLPLADRTNMVFRGTAITGGSGRAIVVATGRATAIGLVQALISETSQPETPLQRKMEALGRRLSWVVLGMGGAVFVLGVLRGFSVLQTLRGAVSLAVAAVPEQLPTIVTVSLARGVQSLVKDGVLVLRLDALEALGSVDAVCFDKTGTLTLNRMSVVAIATFDRTFAVSGGAILDRSRPVALQAGSEISKLMDVCCLSSEAQVQRSGGEQRVSGSPTEAALLRMGLALGKDVATLRREAPIVHTQPRTQEHAYMATWHELPGGRKLLAVKGSPAEVLGLCRWFCAQTKVQPLTDAGRARIRDANGKLAWRGLRVLAVACVEGESVPDEPRDLVWLGLAAIADPPREGMREMLMRLHRAGIETLLLTGDQEATARAIGEELGVERVFGRVNPADKLLIVQKLQREGRVVAMTGDGTNDAPALRAADAGITLGAAGTRVAHGVADVLLLSDNIEALLPAIREGRAVYGNLRKALRFIGPTNASEVAVTLASLAAGFGLPFNPRQLLWTNLLTDVFPALALALDPPAKGLMNRPPDRRRADPQSPENLRTFARDAGVLSAASLAAYAYGLARYGAGARAGSLAFIALTAAQLLHAITAHGRNTASNPLLPASVASGFGLLALAQFAPPVTSALALERAGALDLLVCAAAALSGFAINEAFSAGAQPLTLTRKELDYAALPQS